MFEIFDIIRTTYEPQSISCVSQGLSLAVPYVFDAVWSPNSACACGPGGVGRGALTGKVMRPRYRGAAGEHFHGNLYYLVTPTLKSTS